MTLRLQQTLAACAIAALALCAAVPAHSTPITVTYGGTISDGYDTTGLFGTANRSLAGLLVSTTYSFDLAFWGNNGTTSSGTETITVDGVSKQYTMDGSNIYLNSYVQRDRTDKGPGGWITYDYDDYWYGYNSYSYYQYNYDQLYQAASGYTGDGGYLSSYANVYSYSNPMSIPLDGGSNWSYTAQSGDNTYNSFYLYDQSWGASAYFSSNVTSVTLNKLSDAMTLRPLADADAGGTSDVPEPASALLVTAALAGLIVARRRHTRRRAQPFA